LTEEVDWAELVEPVPDEATAAPAEAEVLTVCVGAGAAVELAAAEVPEKKGCSE
jgi:hypothetical protein